MYNGLPVTAVAASASRSQYGIRSLEVPSSYTEIGDYAFRVCTYIVSVSISSVKKIGAHAFEFCTGLLALDLGSAVESIGDYAFRSAGQYIYSESAGAWQDVDAGILNLQIPGSVSTIGTYAFYGYKGLNSLTFIGDGSYVTVGMYAFRGCTYLNRVEIGAEFLVGSFNGTSAFMDDTALTTVYNYNLSTPLHSYEGQGSNNYGYLVYYATQIIDMNPVATLYLESGDGEFSDGTTRKTYTVQLPGGKGTASFTLSDVPTPPSACTSGEFVHWVDNNGAEYSTGDTVQVAAYRQLDLTAVYQGTYTAYMTVRAGEHGVINGTWDHDGVTYDHVSEITRSEWTVTEIWSGSVPFNTYVSESEVPQSLLTPDDGYVFAGSWQRPNGDAVTFPLSLEFGREVTIIALWSERAKEHAFTLRFVGNFDGDQKTPGATSMRQITDMTATEKESAEHVFTIPFTNEYLPYRADWAFMGWCLSATYGEEYTIFDKSNPEFTAVCAESEESATYVLYAIWVRWIGRIRLNCNFDDERYPSYDPVLRTVTATTEMTQMPVVIPAVEWYYGDSTLQGWALTSSAPEPEYGVTGTVTVTAVAVHSYLDQSKAASVDLYAVWGVVHAHVRYHVTYGTVYKGPEVQTFDAGAGEQAVTCTVTTVLPTFTAHVFAGWVDRYGDGTVYQPGDEVVLPAGDVLDLYTGWSLRHADYLVARSGEGEIHPSVTVTYTDGSRQVATTLVRPTDYPVWTTLVNDGGYVSYFVRLDGLPLIDQTREPSADVYTAYTAGDGSYDLRRSIGGPVAKVAYSTTLGWRAQFILPRVAAYGTFLLNVYQVVDDVRTGYWYEITVQKGQFGGDGIPQCYLVRHKSKGAEQERFYLADEQGSVVITAMNRTFQAQLNEVPILTKPSQNRYVVDLGNTQVIDLRITRAPPAEIDDSQDVDDEHPLAYQHWSNARWVREIKEFADVWQNNNYNSQNEHAGGYQFYFSAGDATLFPEMKKNVFISQSLQFTYGLAVVDLSVRLTVASMLGAGAGCLDATSFDFTYDTIDGDQKTITLVTYTEDVTVPYMPLDAATDQIVWQAYTVDSEGRKTKVNGYFTPGSVIPGCSKDYHFMAVRAVPVRYQLYSHGCTAPGWVSVEDYDVMTVTAVGGGGAGGECDNKNVLGVYNSPHVGGGGGSGAVAVRTYLLSGFSRAKVIPEPGEGGDGDVVSAHVSDAGDASKVTVELMYDSNLTTTMPVVSASGGDGGPRDAQATKVHPGGQNHKYSDWSISNLDRIYGYAAEDEGKGIEGGASKGHHAGSGGGAADLDVTMTVSGTDGLSVDSDGYVTGMTSSTVDLQVSSTGTTVRLCSRGGDGGEGHPNLVDGGTGQGPRFGGGGGSDLDDVKGHDGGDGLVIVTWYVWEAS